MQLLALSCLSVRSHGTTRLPLDGFSWNLVFEFINLYNLSENSCVFELGLELRVLYMMTNIHFRSYLAQFFLKWKMFQIKVVENLETHFFLSITFFENCNVYEIMCKNVVESGRLQMTIRRMRIACWIPKATKHTQVVCSVLFHCINGCANASQCYVTRTLPVS